MVGKKLAKITTVFKWDQFDSGKPAPLGVEVGPLKQSMEPVATNLKQV